MKRRVITFVLAASLFAFTLAGCGGGDEPYIDEPYIDEPYDTGVDYNGEDQNYDGSYDSGESDYDEGQYGPVNDLGLPSFVYNSWYIQYDDGIYTFRIDTDGSWYGWDNNINQTYNDGGEIEVTDEYLILNSKNDNPGIYLIVDEENQILTDSQGAPLTTEDLAAANVMYGNPNDDLPYSYGDIVTEEPLSDICHTWGYMGYYDVPPYDDTTYVFKEDGTFLHCDANGNVMESGTYSEPDGDIYMTEVEMTFDGGTTETMYVLYDGGYMLKDWNGYRLFRLS